MGRWQILELAWDTAKSQCQVSLEGRKVAVLKQLRQNRDGLNYLRIRSAAEGTDTAGMLLASVEVDVENDAVGRMRGKIEEEPHKPRVVAPSPGMESKAATMADGTIRVYTFKKWKYGPSYRCAPTGDPKRPFDVSLACITS